MLQRKSIKVSSQNENLSLLSTTKNMRNHKKYYAPNSYRSFLLGICMCAVLLFTSLILFWNFLANPIRVEYENSDALKAQLNPLPIHEVNQSNVDDPLELGMILNTDDLITRDEGYRYYGFNALISNKLSLERKIPDTRNPLCSNEIISPSLLSTSVIMCFYNEHPRTLFRSIQTILFRTNLDLLHEIILIDDYSEYPPDLHSQVETFVSSLNTNKVTLLKTKQREGLIRARMFGANHATGKILVFLDSHVEVNTHWLEPLLSRIAQNRTIVPLPVIDIINADTFQYTSSALVRGGFNWGLHFKWENLPIGTLNTSEDFIKPIKSPTMAGGLFAIDHEYFNSLGQYDEGLDIWGGENLELSFRVWMCGGSLEIIPCSRIGHVFRSRRPYNNAQDEDPLTRNSLRVAHVWMDDYVEHFLQQRPDARNIDYGDISKRQKLRTQLKCQNFQWYLNNVYPELVLPNDDKERLKKKWSKFEQPKYQPWNQRNRNYTSHFYIQLSNTNLCIGAKLNKTKGSLLVIKSCAENSKQLIWSQTDKNELVLNELLCLEGGSSIPKLSKCHEMGGTQEWRFIIRNETPVYSPATGTCLGVKNRIKENIVIMDICGQHKNTKWDLIPI